MSDGITGHGSNNTHMRSVLCDADSIVMTRLRLTALVATCLDQADCQKAACTKRRTPQKQVATPRSSSHPLVTSCGPQGWKTTSIKLSAPRGLVRGGPTPPFHLKPAHV